MIKQLLAEIPEVVVGQACGATKLVLVENTLGVYIVESSFPELVAM
jgi:hypothetical protein